jgi:hypothetical protein
LTLQHLLALTAIAVAVVALLLARRIARRLDRMTESYWELRYDYGQLRARMTRLEGGGEPEAVPAAPNSGDSSFIPLSSLKR